MATTATEPADGYATCEVVGTRRNQNVKMKIQSLPMQPKIKELESIRGLAALVVVLFHFPMWNPILDIGIKNNGYLMVDLFFVLSGFVIFKAYADRISSGKDLLRFQFLRFGRLYPVHIVFLLTFALIDVSKYIASIKFGITSPNAISAQNDSIASFVSNILLIASVLPNQPLTFNYPSWSISVEFYTYLIFGLSILYVGKFRSLIFFLFATISLLMIVNKSTLGFNDLLRCLTGFFIGCLTAMATNKIEVKFRSCISLSIAIAIIVFLQIKTSKDFDFLIYFLSAALIMSLVCARHSLLIDFLNLRVLTFLGAVSYSVYMSHATIFWIVNQVVRVLSKKPERIILGQSVPQLSQIETLVVGASTVLLILLVSAFVYNFIEVPLRGKSRRFAFSKLS